MSNALYIGVKVVHKASTILWLSLALYTQEFVNVVLGAFETTGKYNLNNYFTNLIHRLNLLNNGLVDSLLHTLHRYYGYYELNKLNTNKELILCS